MITVIKRKKKIDEIIVINFYMLSCIKSPENKIIGQADRFLFILFRR